MFPDGRTSLSVFVPVCRLPPGCQVFCLSVRRGCTAGWRDRELGRFDAYIYSMGKLHFDRTDYSIVVKNRAPLPNSWRWEIYRAGRSSPIEQSSVYFHSVATANRAGKEALRQLLTNSRSDLANPSSQITELPRCLGVAPPRRKR